MNSAFGGGVSKEICGTVRCQYDVTSRVSDFQNGEQSVHRRHRSLTDKNFDFITEILFRFLGFGDFKVSGSIVVEN